MKCLNSLLVNTNPLSVTSSSGSLGLANVALIIWMVDWMLHGDGVYF